MSERPSEIIFAVEETVEGGFVARALRHSIFTEADDLDALREAVRDAVRCHFDGADLPKAIRHEVAASPFRTRPCQGFNSHAGSNSRLPTT